MGVMSLQQRRSMAVTARIVCRSRKHRARAVLLNGVLAPGQCRGEWPWRFEPQFKRTNRMCLQRDLGVLNSGTRDACAMPEPCITHVRIPHAGRVAGPWLVM